MGRIIKMVCVTERNNNKYYNLIQETETTFRAEWGRVGGTTPSTKAYSMHEWDKMYKQKLKRGYRDVTDLVSIAKETEDDSTALAIQNAKPSIVELISFLQAAAKSTIKKNYTVAVADVTQKQVDAAQVMLDALIALSRKRTLDRQAINKALLEMYSIIPRRMTDTRKYLLQPDDSKDKFQRLLSNEQSLLDVMAGQVQTQQPEVSKRDTLNLDDYGLEIDEASETDKKRIAKETDLDLTKVARIFVVRHGVTAKAYEGKEAESPTSKEMLLYHGSRNENWWSILNNGLKIRPANAIRTGSMFGDGIYWANKARKSIGYTSLRGSYWASGSSNRAYLALFSVNVGKTWNIFANGKRYSSEHSRLNNSKVRTAGYDSVYAKGGADLRNDEYIVYEEGRATIKYLIELRK